eukprot:scaffold3068_cov269-Pinguiococcus_pyrenoidosus.AAC.2
MDPPMKVLNFPEKSQHCMAAVRALDEDMLSVHHFWWRREKSPLGQADWAKSSESIGTVPWGRLLDRSRVLAFSRSRALAFSRSRALALSQFHRCTVSETHPGAFLPSSLLSCLRAPAIRSGAQHAQ